MRTHPGDQFSATSQMTVDHLTPHAAHARSQPLSWPLKMSNCNYAGCLVPARRALAYQFPLLLLLLRLLPGLGQGRQGWQLGPMMANNTFPCCGIMLVYIQRLWCWWELRVNILVARCPTILVDLLHCIIIDDDILMRETFKIHFLIFLTLHLLSHLPICILRRRRGHHGHLQRRRQLGVFVSVAASAATSCGRPETGRGRLLS
mmetsp:Transcript_51872/g.94994  ORF Transcript_51872/g.94994 Transcript_51872/m.94994 type:complete len:204 (-) Transcript_51872:340-951(-)